MSYQKNKTMGLPEQDNVVTITTGQLIRATSATENGATKTTGQQGYQNNRTIVSNVTIT